MRRKKRSTSNLIDRHFRRWGKFSTRISLLVTAALLVCVSQAFANGTIHLPIVIGEDVPLADAGAQSAVVLEVAEDIYVEVSVAYEDGDDNADAPTGSDSLRNPIGAISTVPDAAPEGATIVSIPQALSPSEFVEGQSKPEANIQNEDGGGNVFYVSRSGNNGNGRSWATAWNELDQINWSAIQPGALIKIDGGSSEMFYRTQLTVKKSGRSGAPIRIELATDGGRNGRVVIDGGRGTTLPYCGQSSYSDSVDSARRHGIVVDDASWVVIDGREQSGISIRRHRRAGVYLDRDTSNVTLRNMEIYDNGEARRSGSGWISAKPGVRLGGNNHVLEGLNVHDNGEDGIQSLWGDNNLGNILIKRTWLHNERRHPSVAQAFNYCIHTDGIQIYDGGLIRNITIEESVIGPGLTNGIILGQTRTSNNTWADVQDVTIRDTIFTKGIDNNIYSYQNTNTRNWVLNNVTLDCTNNRYNCINIDTSQHKIHNSIFYGSRLFFKNGLDNYGNNCHWKTPKYGSFQIGEKVDPQFYSINESDPFALNDYRMPSNSPCADKGASITSVQNMLNGGSTAPPSSNPTSTPAPTPTSVPPSNPVPTPTSTPTPEPPSSGSPPRSGQPLCRNAASVLFEAEKGYLWGSFGTENGSLRQLFDVDKPWNGFLATYRFNISQGGTYMIRTRVSAPSTERNSFFVNMGQEPIGSSDAMVWDIPVTSGFEERIMTWRGSGSETNNQVNPLTFDLSPGTHNFYIRGREANTLLDQICIELR